jgi:hypothetical protein
MALPYAHAGDVNAALCKNPCIPDLRECGAGFLKAARNPGRYCAYPQAVRLNDDSLHLFLVKPRYCHLFAENYLAFCYPDRDLLQDPVTLLKNVRRLVPRFLGQQSRASRGIRALLTGLSEQEHARFQHYSRFEESGQALDPEGLRDFTPLERTADATAVAEARARVGKTVWEWQRAGVVVRPTPPADLNVAFELQSHLNDTLHLDYRATMRAGMRELVGFDFTRPSWQCLRRAATHGVMLEAVWDGQVTAVGWFYRSFNAPRNRWELWGRRCVVHPDFKGQRFGSLLWDGAVGLFSKPDTELRLRTLLHPRARGGPRGFTPPASESRSRYLVTSAGR